MKTLKLGLLSKGSAVVLLAASGMTSHIAVAQDASNDEIIVTARKTEESLQKVPVSISAFTEAFIENANIANINDLSGMTPGFQQQQAFGRDGDRPVMRGTSNILISEGKVGIFVDGVPVVGDTSALDFNSFEQIEIIRGPQSAVFGRGTLSGAINYITKKPSNEFEVNLKATAAEWNEYQLFGAVSGPLIEDKLYGYVSGKYFRFGGDRTNEITGNDLGQKSTTFNAGLKFQPSDGIDLGLRYIYSEDDDDHFAIALQDSSSNNCQLNSRGYFCGVVESPDSIRLNTDDILGPGLQRETHRFIGTADIDLGDSGYSLSGLFGYTDSVESSGAVSS